jgi:RNA polymerase sigma-70 factor (ECF subfamily)
MAKGMADLEAIYRRYGLLVERRCRRIVGPADARDAAHETFARAVRKLESFRGEGERLAWLYRISTHVCLNVMRDRKRRGDAWLGEVAAARPTAAHGEDVIVDRQAALRALDAIHDELTQALVVHVYLDEMSQGEAADLLGISRATANTRLGAWKARARVLLGEHP